MNCTIKPALSILEKSPFSIPDVLKSAHVSVHKEEYHCNIA